MYGISLRTEALRFERALRKGLNRLLPMQFQPEEQEAIIESIHDCLTALEASILPDVVAHRLAKRYSDLPEILAVFDEEGGTAILAAQVVANFKFQRINDDVALAPLLVHPTIQ